MGRGAKSRDAILYGATPARSAVETVPSQLTPSEVVFNDLEPIQSKISGSFLLTLHARGWEWGANQSYDVFVSDLHDQFEIDDDDFYTGLWEHPVEGPSVIYLFSNTLPSGQRKQITILFPPEALEEARTDNHSRLRIDDFDYSWIEAMNHLAKQFGWQRHKR